MLCPYVKRKAGEKAKILTGEKLTLALGVEISMLKKNGRFYAAVGK